MTRPTGHKLAPTTLQSVLDRINGGVNNSKIYEQTGVTRCCTRQIRRSLAQFGQPYPPVCVKRGRPATLRAIHQKRLREYLASRPQAYMEEIRDWLLDDFDVVVSLSLVARELKKMKFSRKIATKRAAEQSEPLRRVFRARLQQNYHAEQIVAIDESACNERTSDRKYGWGPIGEAVELEYSMKRSERWSVLPAMTIDGYLAHRIFQGSITSEIMEDFLEHQVLPLCTRNYHVLLMDNASIHRSPRIRELCHAFGVQLEFLPPYSPDYNPIERSFKALKSWIKRYGQHADNWQYFGTFLEYAVQRSCYDIDCKSWYRRCGYAGQDVDG